MSVYIGGAELKLIGLFVEEREADREWEKNRNRYTCIRGQENGLDRYCGDETKGSGTFAFCVYLTCVKDEMARDKSCSKNMEMYTIKLIHLQLV